MNQEIQTQIQKINAGISRINSMYSKWAQKNNINQYTIGIFYMLLDGEHITQKQVCDEFEIPKQSVNNVIISLKSDGYICMESGEKDKREKNIVLTEKGREYAMEVLAPLFQIEENVALKMGKQRMSQLIKTIITFGDILEQEISEAEKE